MIFRSAKVCMRVWINLGYGEYTVSTDAGLAPLVAEKAEIWEDSKEVIL